MTTQNQPPVQPWHREAAKAVAHEFEAVFRLHIHAAIQVGELAPTTDTEYLVSLGKQFAQESAYRILAAVTKERDSKELYWLTRFNEANATLAKVCAGLGAAEKERDALAAKLSTLETRYSELKGMIEKDSWTAEMQEAIGYIISPFLGNDAWQLGVKRMAESHQALAAKVAGLEAQVQAQFKQLVQLPHSEADSMLNWRLREALAFSTTALATADAQCPVESSAEKLVRAAIMANKAALALPAVDARKEGEK